MRYSVCERGCPSAWYSHLASTVPLRLFRARTTSSSLSRTSFDSAQISTLSGFFALSLSAGLPEGDWGGWAGTPAARVRALMAALRGRVRSMNLRMGGLSAGETEDSRSARDE